MMGIASSPCLFCGARLAADPIARRIGLAACPVKHDETHERAHLPAGGFGKQIGRAHVCTPVTNAQPVCRLLLEKKKQSAQTNPYSPTIFCFLYACFCFSTYQEVSVF